MSAQNDNAKPKAAAGQATRLAMEYVWWDGPIDIPNVNTSGTKCGDGGIPGRAYWEADFIPAYQVIELRYCKNGKATDTWMVPMAQVKKVKSF